MYGTPLPHITTSTDRYGFVNENQIRAGAGITLFLALYSFISILFFGSYTIPLILMTVLWIDFVIKVFHGPKYSISLYIASFFVRKTYWVGAMQKRFAWSIGLILSSIAFGCVLVTSGFLNYFGIASELYAFVQTLPVPNGLAVAPTLPIAVCAICIVFMTLESVFGYCVGCKMYAFFVRHEIMRAIPNQNCANGVCEIRVS